MLLYILADDILTGLGQVSATILAIYMFVFILIGLGVIAGLMFGFVWVRQKAELVKKLRPIVDSINATTESALKGTPPAPGSQEIKIVRTVAEVPARIHTVEEKIEQVDDRVAEAVIEFRARTMMVQGIVKSFLLPGLTKPKPRALQTEKQLEFKSPGYRILMEKAASETPVGAVDGYTGAVTAQDLKAVGSEPGKEPLIGTAAQTKNAPVR